MKNKLIEICKKAKKASNQIIDNKIKNKVLIKFAHLVNKNKFKILSNNKKDVFNAKKNGLKNNMIERLELNEKKIEDIVSSIKQISRIKDTVNVILKQWKTLRKHTIFRTTNKNFYRKIQFSYRKIVFFYRHS